MVTITINGIDVRARYGITLAESGLAALRKPAPMKKFIESKSRLEHGKRIVRKNPRVDERSLILPINLTAASETDFLNKYNLFVTEVLETGWLQIVVSSQSTVVYKCEYEDCQQYSEFMQGIAKFLLKLTEPNPKDRTVSSQDDSFTNN